MACVSGPVATRRPVEFRRIRDRADEFAGGAGEIRFLEVPTRRFVKVDGSGPPAQAEFAARLPALYGTAWSLRFALKRRGVLSTVRPLEGFWWTTNGLLALDTNRSGDRDEWRWSLGIALPDAASDDEVAVALAAGRERVERDIATAVRTEWVDEGQVAQVLHVGPYAGERPTIEALRRAIVDAGLRPTGHHHEIYLGDPRRAAPDRLRTLIRQPVSGAG